MTCTRWDMPGTVPVFEQLVGQEHQNLRGEARKVMLWQGH
jgi:hypothetical protein